MNKWQDFKHITKLDPDKKNTSEIIKVVCESDTDAVMISGTTGITRGNVTALYKALRDGTDKPILVEPVNKNTVLYEVDYLYIPVVLNSQIMEFTMQLHLSWFKDLVELKVDIPWDRIVTEGYIILNPESAVAQVTKAICNLSDIELSAYANYSQLLGLDAVYIEYSGKFGDIEKVKVARNTVTKSKLFYGGGVSNAAQTKSVLEEGKADTIFVGNIVYDDIEAYLSTIPKK